MIFSEKLTIGSEPNEGNFELFGDMDNLREVLIQGRFGPTADDKLESLPEEKFGNSFDFLRGEFAFDLLAVLVIGEVAHRTAQVARHNGIQSDEEMTHAKQMSCKHGREFQPVASHQPVEPDQLIDGVHLYARVPNDHTSTTFPAMAGARGRQETADQARETING